MATNPISLDTRPTIMANLLFSLTLNPPPNKKTLRLSHYIIWIQMIFPSICDWICISLKNIQLYKAKNHRQLHHCCSIPVKPPPFFEGSTVQFHVFSFDSSSRIQRFEVLEGVWWLGGVSRTFEVESHGSSRGRLMISPWKSCKPPFSWGDFPLPWLITKG